MDGLAQFHFLRPLWLLALLPAALLPWLVGWHGDVRRRWRQTIAPHLLDALVVEQHGGWRLRPVHLTALLIAVGALALAGPTWQRDRPPFVEEKAPLAIAIDLSPTMDAIDLSPTRLERAKLKVKALLALRPGARTAIYAYAGSTHLVLPLTEDAQLVQTFVDALQTRIMPVAGRDTALALRTIDAALAKEDTPGTVVFFTDGVESGAGPAFKAQVDSGRTQPVVLGFGTEQGGPVRAASGDAFVQDASGRQLFARLDVAALQRLKRESGTPVATVTPDSDDDVRWVQRRVQSHLAQKEAEADVRWKEAGWWLTLPVVLLGALWFRKGWTVRWVGGWLLVLLVGAMGAAPRQGLAQAAPAPAAASPPAAALPPGVASPPAAASPSAAAPPAGWHFADLWLTPDQQGRRAFQAGDFEAAAALFRDPMWRGVALYRAGHPAQAAQAFALVDSAEGEFNQGNALAQQKRYPEAAARYTQALQRRPGWKEAQANLELVRKLTPPKEKDEPQEEAPEMKPDQIQFDDKGKQGTKQTQVPNAQSADTWMRNIQTSPTELLARKFALQTQRVPGAKP